MAAVRYIEMYEQYLCKLKSISIEVYCIEVICDNKSVMLCNWSIKENSWNEIFSEQTYNISVQGSVMKSKYIEVYTK